MNDIREQIEQLRNDAATYMTERLHGPTDAMREAADFWNKTADTMEKLLQRNELLEAVYGAAKDVWLVHHHTIGLYALQEALAAVWTRLTDDEVAMGLHASLDGEGQEQNEWTDFGPDGRDDAP